MALTFATASTDNVNCGSASVLDNLTTITAICWVYPTSVASAIAFITKSVGGAASGWRFYTNSGGPTNLRFRWARNANANPMDYIGNAGSMSANAWQCVAGTVNQAG